MPEEFHSSATHVDAHGLPVAFSKADNWPFHPTPCCGATVSIFDDGTVYCKGCYGEADPLFCGMPAEPLKRKETT